jgi:hypothetical protein
MCVVTLVSTAPLSQQIWGTFGRNTGLLAYLSLAIILLVSSEIRELNFHIKLSKSLIMTSIPLSLYCFIQMSGNDPIGWSLFQTFGTLGNINFLSSFLGMSSCMCLAFLFSSPLDPIRRLFIATLMVSQLVIIESTGSIQGLFVFAMGFVVVVFLRLGNKARINARQYIVLLATILSAIPVVFGIVNKGPLAKYLYQTSTGLRADYWHAGYKMLIDHPIFGVGMDSYGDWYRQARGEISTLRGVDRTANTAHNIPLDIGSSGGFILLLLYICFLFLAAQGMIKFYKSTNGIYSPFFAGLTSVWFGYQLQSLVSINQLGVGIWGWIITGSLIGLGKINLQNLDSSVQFKSQKNRKRRVNQTLPPKIFLRSVATTALGLVLIWFPVRADASHFSAMRSGNSDRIKYSTELPGTTAFHIDRVVNEALRLKDYVRANEYALKVTEKFPRDYFAWKAIWVNSNTPPELREKARMVLKDLDPFNPEFK